MTEPEPTPETTPLDPKEAMRQALERKKNREHPSAAQGTNPDRGHGHAHGPAGSQREFRRKSG